MPSQQTEILETIHGLKRALRREKEAATDQPITGATNRGNKLKKGASYVHAGALPYPHGPGGYKQQIEHAGYTRYILDRNPRRHNEYGDELEDSESDLEADADADDENPYSGVHIEELLGPLKHPSELATHPTLSIPFLDTALPDMVQTTEEKLRQERANLWRAKHLHRQVIGDESWMPCGAVETRDDWDLFEPKPKTLGEGSKKRKRHEVSAVQNGAVQEDSDTLNSIQDTADTQVPERVQTGKPQPEAEKSAAEEDVEMHDQEPTTNGVAPRKSIQEESTQPDSTESNINGEEPPKDDEAYPNSANTSHKSTPPPARRITRALAAETLPNEPTSPSPSISTISSSMLQPDPIFLLPPSLIHRPQVSTFPLPIDELLETRRLLTMFIQKQEETIRSTESLIGKLIKAKRMRSNVWEWCKAEGHTGEMSDGEDWIDEEEWGLERGSLGKGRDEDDNGQGGEEGHGEGGVGIVGGRKKRRNRRERE